MSTHENKPAETIRDGAIKATIWRNFGDKGTFYSVEITRTYTDQAGNYHDARTFSGAEPLRASRLYLRAYDRMTELRQQDNQQAGGAGGSS